MRGRARLGAALAAVAAGLAATVLLLGAGGGHGWWVPHRARFNAPWPPPSQDLEVPDGGFDLRYTQQQIDLAYYLARRVVRVDTVHVPPPPYDPDNLRVEDGGGTVVAPGVLLTTARYLTGATRVYAVLRSGRHLPLRVRKVDARVGLALLTFEPAKAPKLQAVVGVGPVPPPAGEANASEVVMPATLEGDAASVRLAAALVDGPTLYLSGQALNGIPAFDTRGRLVAVALRMTPDRSRSLGVGGAVISAWLAANLGGGAQGGADGGADGGAEGADGGAAAGRRRGRRRGGPRRRSRRGGRRRGGPGRRRPGPDDGKNRPPRGARRPGTLRGRGIPRVHPIEEVWGAGPLGPAAPGTRGEGVPRIPFCCSLRPEQGHLDPHSRSELRP